MSQAYEWNNTSFLLPFQVDELNFPKPGNFLHFKSDALDLCLGGICVLLVFLWFVVWY